MRSVIKILFTLGAGEAVARGFHVLGFVFLARIAGKEALGQLGFAVAVTSYLLFTVQQGLDVVVIRNVAREPALLKCLASAILGLRLSIAAVITTGILTYVVSKSEYNTADLLLTALTLSYFGAAITLKWTFQALEQPRPIAVTNLVAQACFLIGVLFVRGPSQIVWAAAAQGIGEIIAALLLWVTFWRLHGRIVPTVDLLVWRDLVRDSWPISISVLLGIMMYNFDALALGFYGYRAELGVYLACYRFVMMSTVVLGLVQVSAFPALSRTYPNRQASRAILMSLTRYVVVVTLMPALILVLWASPVLGLVYGAPFQQGTQTLKVLAVILPVQAARAILRLGLFAYHQQRQDTVNVLYGVFTNIIMDLALIPIWGVMACAFSSVCSELVVLASTYFSYIRTMNRENAEPNEAHASA